MTTDHKFNKFLSKWRMNVVDSSKRVNYCRPFDISPYSFDNAGNYGYTEPYESETLYTIQITENDLSYISNFHERVEESMKYTGSMDVFQHYIQKQKEESTFRQENAAVQKAYDHYVMLYKLAKAGA